ncbi:hypothetical protein BS47DRAFT_1359087 [Hydnum rufescens UP504]|uniref:Uncharacterized protein n=1 Tax=Hydnum rufescens UP504 TaxID=1448309 RepID=A0A9P6B6W2_9AGAM|nr:hypothetical protein BS47DRAFT_1359087 [Hydnum rufescens UP504]
MPISRPRKVDFNQARIDAWNSPDYNIPIYEPGQEDIVRQARAICEATGANIDEASNAIGMDSHVGPKFLGASVNLLSSHRARSTDPHKPPPAPARTDDDDTGKEEAPHTHCGGGVTLDRQTCTNPAPAPARTDDDDYWGEICECAQPRLKYGATHPLKQVCGNIRLFLPPQNPAPIKAETMPMAKYGARSHPDPNPRVSIQHPHTRFGGCVVTSGPFPKRKPAQQRHARALNTKFDAQPPKPQVLNMTMDLISYHTPAAVEQSQGPRQNTDLRSHLQPDMNIRSKPARMPPYPWSHTSCCPSLHENSPDENMAKAPT